MSVNKCKGLIATFTVLFVLNMQAFAGVPQAANIYGIGSISQSSRAGSVSSPSSNTYPNGQFSKPKVLISTPQANSNAATYNGFFDGATSTPYSVPNGSTYHINRICIESQSSSGSVHILGTSTATLTGSTSRPTNDKYFGGGGAIPPGSTSGQLFTISGTTGGSADKCWDMHLTVAQNLFPFWENFTGVAAAIYLYGEESTP
jgi:hypothetical protein